MLLRAQVTS